MTESEMLEIINTKMTVIYGIHYYNDYDNGNMYEFIFTELESEKVQIDVLCNGHPRPTVRIDKCEILTPII